MATLPPLLLLLRVPASGLSGKKAIEPGEESLAEFAIRCQVALTDSQPNKAGMFSGRQPSVDLGFGDFGVLKFAVLNGNIINIGLCQRPYLVAVRHHLSNEIFEIARGRIIRHYPDADARAAKVGI